MILKNTFALLLGAVMLFACTKESDVNKKIEEDLGNLKTLEVYYKAQAFKALSQATVEDGLRSEHGYGVSEEDYAQFSWDMMEKVDFDPEKNLKPYLSSQGLSDETVNILASLKEYLKTDNLLSADDISKLNIPYDEKKLLVQAFSSLSVAVDYEGDALRSSRAKRVADAIEDCWDQYLEDLAFYTAVGAGVGSAGGPWGFALGGVGGVFTARYEFYKCKKQANKIQ